LTVDRSKALAERLIGVGVLIAAALAPVFVSDFWVEGILIQTFILGTVAASMIFLSAYGGMISLAQLAVMGIAGYLLGNMVTQRVPGGETKGLTLGWDPTLSIALAILGATILGLILGAVASRSFGIYFLMLTLVYAVIANLFFGSVTQFGGFSPIAGIWQYTPGFIGDIVNDRERLYYIAAIVALVSYLLIRYLVRTPFGISFQGIRDEPLRMASLGYNVALHRTLAFGFAAFIASLAGVLYVWWNGQIAPGDIGLLPTIQLLVICVIGGLSRIEGAWLGALTFVVIENYVRDVQVPILGGSFNTVIGFIFLAIVIVSPDGLMGLWERMWRIGVRRGGPPPVPVEPAERAASATPS
jgi:branched-chain amino acid transport system permease protein